MAAGEYISVASQKDTELADVDKERQQQEAGPRAREEELEELAQIYVGRGLDYGLAKQVGLLLCPQSCSLRSPALPCIHTMRARKQRPCQGLPSGICKCSIISQECYHVQNCQLCAGGVMAGHDRQVLVRLRAGGRGPVQNKGHGC